MLIGIQACMTTSLMTLRNFMTQKKMSMSTKTLIVMGSIAIELLQNKVHYMKKSSSTRLIALILMSSLTISLMRYTLNVFVIYMALMLAMSLQLSLTSSSTFAVTTQFARGRVSDTLKQHWRSSFPACNVKRCNEPVATDTVFSDTPAVDSGVTAAQIFVGREYLVADVYGLNTDKEFVNT
jgi:hypothetical protein